VNREISYGAWVFETTSREALITVEVKPNGDIHVTQGESSIVIRGMNVREAFWLADVMQQAGEMSKKRPLDS
jgi:hypothetical protein